MSPEQIGDGETTEIGNGEFDYRSDWWMFANLVLILVVGEKPFESMNEATNMEERLACLRNGDYGANYEPVRNCTPEFQDLLRMLYKVDPADRPSYKQIITHPWFFPDEQTWLDSNNPMAWYCDEYDEIRQRPNCLASAPIYGEPISMSEEQAEYLGMWPYIDIRGKASEYRTQRREEGNPIRDDCYWKADEEERQRLINIANGDDY